MKEELNYLSRQLMLKEDKITELELYKSGTGSEDMKSHYEGRINHAQESVDMLNSIIDYITRKELNI